MKDIARDHLGVRTDVPWRDLTDRERDIVLHAPPEKHHMVYQIKKDGRSGDMDFTFFNAIHTVENALKNVKDEKSMKRVAKFLKEGPCPDCGGTRLSERARAPLLRGIPLDKACEMTLAEAEDWVRGVPASLPKPMRPMAERICESFHDTSRRLWTTWSPMATRFCLWTTTRRSSRMPTGSWTWALAAARPAAGSSPPAPHLKSNPVPTA